MHPLSWSDAAFVMLCGGALGYALGVCSCVSFYLARTAYWKKRYDRIAAVLERARPLIHTLERERNPLLRRQAE